MADYKKAQEEFRKAQRQLWTADDSVIRTSEDVRDAEMKEAIADQAFEDTKKRLDTWTGIYAKGTFDARQREIQKIQDLAPEFEEMKGLQMTIPEHLEALNDQHLELLKGLAENNEKAKKAGISLEAYNRAAMDLNEIRKIIPNMDVMENTIQRLQKDDKEDIKEGKWERLSVYLSKKLPYASERKALYEKYGAQVEKMIITLNQEIDADDNLKKQVGSVEDVWAESASIEAMKQELANQKQRSLIPEKAEQIAALSEKDSRRVVVQAELESYQESKRQVEAAKAAVDQAGMEKTEIPKTFTDLKKLAKKNQSLYEVKENQINQMMQAKMTDAQRHSTDFPKSLSEYLEKEQALEELKADTAKAKKESRGFDYIKKSEELEKTEKKFAESKQQIKAWIAEENKQSSKKRILEYEAKEKALKTAEEELKKAGKLLEEAGKQYNEAPVQRLEAAIQKMTEEHKAHEKLLADRVVQWNLQHKENVSKEEAVEVSRQKEKDRLLKSVKKALSETIDAQSKVTIEALEMDQKEVERQKQGLEELLKEENRRILAANEKIREENRKIFKTMMRQENDEVKKYWKGQEAQLKSDCRNADFMKSVAGIAADTIGYVTESFRDLMMAMTDAVIKGEVEEEREKAEAIKGELDAVKRRQEERVFHMDEAVRKDGQERREISFSDMSQDLRRIEDLNEKKESLQNALIVQNQLVSEMDAGLEEKIRENHAAIDASFGSIKPYDEKEVEEYLSQMEAIYQEAAGNNSLQQKLSEAGTLAERQNLENMTAENRKMMEELQKSREFIQAGSEKAVSLLKPSSIGKINTFIDTGMKVVNFALKKSADAKKAAAGVSVPESASEINLSEQLNSLKEKLQNPEASTTPQIVQQLMEVGTLLCGTLKGINQEVQDYRKEAHSKAIDKHCELENMQNLQKGFQAFQEEIKDDPEMGKKSYAEQLKVFLNQNSKSARQIVEEQTNFLQQAVAAAEINAQKAKDQTGSQKQNQKKQQEQVAEAENNYRQKKQELKQAFLDTVRENADKPNGSVKVSSEELSLAGENRKERGFAFLSKLTGTEMNENMNPEDAMDAFSRVYINGLNASSYFQMGSRYSEAMKGNEEAQKQFLQDLAEHGDDLRSAMEYTMYPAAGRTLSEGAKQLAGQMFAVENSNMMLQPVLLEIPSPESGKQMSGITEKQVSDYNRYVQMTTDSFNEMRKEASGIEKKKQASVSGPETGRKQVRLNELETKDRMRQERMTKAVHASRKESLEKRRQEEKLPAPRTRRPGK